MSDREWFTVATTTTNSVEGSTFDVFINTTPICPNMTNAQFRKRVMTARDGALKLVNGRIILLSTVWSREKVRVQTYFGSTSEEVRAELLRGLSALCGVLERLEPSNFIRPDPETERVLGCVPNPNQQSGTLAHVCGPDTATHTIAIHEAFCSLRDETFSSKESMQSTIIHECTHFYDTFASIDYQNIYYGKHQAQKLARLEPAMAIKNADNITWYIVSTDD